MKMNCRRVREDQESFDSGHVTTSIGKDRERGDSKGRKKGRKRIKL